MNLFSMKQLKIFSIFLENLYLHCIYFFFGFNIYELPLNQAKLILHLHCISFGTNFIVFRQLFEERIIKKNTKLVFYENLRQCSDITFKTISRLIHN